LHSRHQEIVTVPGPLLLCNRERRLQVSLPFVLSHFLLRSETPFLVQIGAFNGCDGDPVHDFVKKGWLRGCLLEPQPDAFEDLQETYRGVAGVRLLNCAISDNCGMRKLYRIRPGTPGPSWINQLASFDRRTILKHAEIPNLEHLEQAIIELDVPCVNFDWLLADLGIQRVDVLIVDTEGYDFEVLKLLNLPVRLPAIVHYEHRHLSRADVTASIELLMANGYFVAVDPADVTAYRCPGLPLRTTECNADMMPLIPCR